MIVNNKRKLGNCKGIYRRCHLPSTAASSKIGFSLHGNIPRQPPNARTTSFSWRVLGTVAGDGWAMSRQEENEARKTSHKARILFQLHFAPGRPRQECQELFQAVPSTVSKHEDCEPVSCIVALTNLNCFMHQEWPYLQKTRSFNINVSQPLVYSCFFGVSA